MITNEIELKAGYTVSGVTSMEAPTVISDVGKRGGQVNWEVGETGYNTPQRSRIKKKKRLRGQLSQGQDESDSSLECDGTPYTMRKKTRLGMLWSELMPTDTESAEDSTREFPDEGISVLSVGGTEQGDEQTQYGLDAASSLLAFSSLNRNDDTSAQIVNVNRPNVMDSQRKYQNSIEREAWLKDSRPLILSSDNEANTGATVVYIFSLPCLSQSANIEKVNE
ncbi:MOB kinase activator 1B isoform X5 [Rhineura floridana]|uniref:MOB kinase activator 1B isoform X5 n=1 Tax=Rhineura floridana TaxID=261503 RepID=UPI002AC7F57B|nr:MOB kinase activator 1B isoform X5 [Rhineura floridana]